MPIRRCPWCGTDSLYRDYHDHEWGVPVHDNRRLFEMLILEGTQAGLSWLTILRKRNHYRHAFDSFDPERIARYEQPQIDRLLADTGIVRNRRKIEAAIKNAQGYLQLQEQQGAFNTFLWQFVDFSPKQNQWQSVTEVPSHTPESENMSRALRHYGFSFVGPTICYAFMQAVGMVNDHVIDCFRHSALSSPTSPQTAIDTMVGTGTVPEIHE
ncbi:MAG: DNA-3-methyladenine glycosylase I [Candidatus Contendobacter odensis]|uniref:DNA-3-methyladenine glycosylase I n=1 Tax=Candidatus Contendibacter odensensis TaxID=1400860 RepID=A0A2G6PEE4_9GAMM|nr:MAG: DNA-3-methyladenine glycosylase I [Candidatus Contendobacter odensis]